MKQDKTKAKADYKKRNEIIVGLITKHFTEYKTLGIKKALRIFKYAQKNSGTELKHLGKD